MNESTIRLQACDLFSKFGFMDGDILHHLDLEIKNDSHKLLYHLVEKYLLPLISEEISLQFWTTCHNPCRISEKCERRYPNLQEKINHIYFDIPISMIILEYENLKL